MLDARGALAGWIEHRDVLRAYAGKDRLPIDPGSDGVAPRAGV